MKPHRKAKGYSKQNRLAKLAAEAASTESRMREELQDLGVPDRWWTRRHRWAREYLWKRRG